VPGGVDAKEFAKKLPYLSDLLIAEQFQKSPEEVRGWPLRDKRNISVLNAGRNKAREEQEAKDKWRRPRGVYE
jgi:hypothetical protein